MKSLGPFRPLYDVAGRLLTADNADAKVKRSYYPNGLMQTDSLRIHPVDRNDNNWDLL